MLAYLFWHRPTAGVERAAYEEAQRALHAALEVESACFRLEALPFGEMREGYEDWYLVDDWRELGALNEMAIDRLRGPAHDRAASLSAEGWGGLYAHVWGDPVIPRGAEWLHRPRGRPAEELLGELPETTAWQRQLVLGPAPELCLAVEPSPAREAVWPGG